MGHIEQQSFVVTVLNGVTVFFFNRVTVRLVRPFNCYLKVLNIINSHKIFKSIGGYKAGSNKKFINHAAFELEYDNNYEAFFNAFADFFVREDRRFGKE